MPSCIFVVGWRGEPGIYDEPQHIYQGEVTVRLLEDMGIEVFVLSKDTEEKELCDAMIKFSEKLKLGKNIAIVVRKGALSYDAKIEYKNANEMKQ